MLLFCVTVGTNVQRVETNVEREARAAREAIRTANEATVEREVDSFFTYDKFLRMIYCREEQTVTIINEGPNRIRIEKQGSKNLILGKFKKGFSWMYEATEKDKDFLPKLKQKIKEEIVRYMMKHIPKIETHKIYRSSERNLPSLDPRLLEKVNRTLCKGKKNFLGIEGDLSWYSFSAGVFYDVHNGWLSFSVGGVGRVPMYRNKGGQNEDIHWLEEHGLHCKLQWDKIMPEEKNNQENIQVGAAIPAEKTEANHTQEVVVPSVEVMAMKPVVQVEKGPSVVPAPRVNVMVMAAQPVLQKEDQPVSQVKQEVTEQVRLEAQSSVKLVENYTQSVVPVSENIVMKADTQVKQEGVEQVKVEVQSVGTTKKFVQTFGQTKNQGSLPGSENRGQNGSLWALFSSVALMVLLFFGNKV